MTTQSVDAPQSNMVDSHLSRVADDQGNRPLWIGLGVIGLAGLALFSVLESRRLQTMAPAIKPKASELALAPAPLPTLYIPAEPLTIPPPQTRASRSLLNPSQFSLTRETPPVRRALTSRSTSVDSSDGAPPYPLSARVSAVAPERTSVSSPLVVYDGGTPARGLAESPTALTASGASNGSPQSSVAIRARFGPIVNRTYTVEQGTLIPAVLETAIDSTQPGRARALVSSSVYSIDGNRILIGRGSKLIGEYRGDLATGQKRAFVQWTRLVRPDGVIVDLDSPATDTLGRAGIRGRVDSQFFERFAGALLQSTLDLGSFALSRKISNSGVVVAIPGATQASTSQLIQPAGKPTIRIRQGTRISILVARDLDFSGVERDP